ncbi:MAG TPA: LLM class flavin-dependent oxidoreductase [Actinopolymorphaceae bacterium]|jgi:alkanesulfonate monooxygenase SsuD/methylene tetrahydromethanopterin reductase-like flavin-dependent oxidoreductase (luciferase family)/hemerythrin-like domain-containing protein
MPDYGHDLLFGVFLPPLAARAETVLSLAERADALSLDLVSFQDHPYQPAFLDTWTLLTAAATRTRQARLFPNVANLPLRDPAVLARSAASLDILSGGRVELGLGAGAFWDAIAAMGGPRRTPKEAVAALAEAIEVIRALWKPGRGVKFAGRHYRLDGTKPGPLPVHPIGIWLGAYRPRMIRLTGRVADGWIPSSAYAPPETLADMNAIIDEAAHAAGRSPGEIRRLYNVGGRFTGTGAEFLQGPPAVWVEQLAELALTDGISGFVLTVDLDAESDIQRFAEEVVPGVRELVEAERRTTRREPTSSDSDRATVETHESARGASVNTRPNLAAGETTQTRPTHADGRGAANVFTVLGVTPTPDTGERLTNATPWDESERPHAPAPDPDTTYTVEGRTESQRLVAIHDHLRDELRQIRDIVAQVLDGAADVAAARSAINAMTIRQNNWTVGAYCQSYCRIVTVHHTIEDQALFPHLRKADPRLGPVVDRLELEHHAIAGILDRLDAALVAFVKNPASAPELRFQVDVLTDALLSHLSYEEHELLEPLARFPFEAGLA